MMYSRFTRTFRLPSLLLAAALQVLPIVRAALPATGTAVNTFAILFRWVAGTAAALGGVHAVSGASTAITSPLNVNGTNGRPFSLRLSTAPDQAHYWSTTTLPAGLSLAGTNGQTLWRIIGTPSVTGTYSVGLTAKDQASSSGSRTVSATLTINILSAGTPPAITVPPTSQTIVQGKDANFTVSATGTAPLAYQWRFKASSLPGKTNDQLFLTSVSPANAGNYDVTVRNAAGSVTSVVASLTVLVPPSITTPPNNVTAALGGNAAFSVSATGSTPLNYQWRFEGNDLPGQTGQTLILNPVLTGNSGSYDVIIANGAGSVTSAVARLTVVVPPSILTSPTPQTVTQGQDATFNVSVTGSAPITYFWRKDTAVIAVTPNPSWTLSNAQPADGGSYSVIVSNFAGIATSASALLTVNPAPQAPFISNQPTNRAVLPGNATTFIVVAGGTAPLEYQWSFANAPVLGQTSASYTLPNVQASDLGSYFVVVSNSLGSVTSAVANLSFILPPVIMVQPQNQTNTTGSNATFTVTASSSVPVGYQWLKNNVNLQNNSRINGTQSSTLSIANLQTNDVGAYLVVVTNVAGSITSQVAFLTVTLPPTAPLVVQIQGAGTVTPDYNGQFLQLGRTYTITAQPATGNVFAGWTGSIASSTPALTFVMQSNLVLQADFVPGALSFTKGNYSGLFYDPADPRHQSSGSVAVNTTATRKFSAAVVVAGRKYSWSGEFSVSRRATNVVKRAAPLAPLRVELEIDPADPDQIQGIVSDGSWSASLLADRRVFNTTTQPCPFRGRYTLTISGKLGAADVPQGDGFGTAIVTAAGQMTVAGKLADGLKFSRSGPVSKEGHWPCYVPLYSRTGMILSWQTFTNRSADDLNGQIIWIRGQQPSAAFYPVGFTIVADASGSMYLAPDTSSPAWSIVPAQYDLTGGNLTQDLGGPLTPSANNQMVGADANHLTIKVTPKSGVFTGSFVDPATGRPVSFNGVLLQKSNHGSGFFLGENQSGRVLLAP